MGRGPFFGADAFYRAALDALIDCAPHAAKWTDWTAGGALTLLEEYNGLAYAARGVPSAYVWSGSDQYNSGNLLPITFTERMRWTLKQQSSLV